MKRSLDGPFAHGELVLSLFDPRAELTVHALLVRLQNQPRLLRAIKSKLESRLRRRHVPRAKQRSLVHVAHLFLWTL